MPQSPPAEMVTTLQKQIAGYVLMPTNQEVLETALAGMRRAIDRLNTREWNWTLDHDTITFVAGQVDYTVDNQVKMPRNFDFRDTAGVVHGRFHFIPWASFNKELAQTTASGTPLYYSFESIHINGSISLDTPPSSAWAANYPTGRFVYFKRIQYPGSEPVLDVPPEVVGFIAAHAEAYTADRYAIDKADNAYERAERAHLDIVRSDNNVQTDWE